MAMALPLQHNFHSGKCNAAQNQKSIVQLQGSKATLPTNTKNKPNSSRGAEADGNGSNSHGSIGINGNLRRLCKQGRLKEAVHILHSMDDKGIRADTSIYASLLQVCLEQKALQEGRLVHAHMIDSGINADTILRTKFVILYAKCGSLADARRTLDEMPEKNVVSWTATISAYARQGHNEEALALYDQMQGSGIQPNQFTFASVLPACAGLAVLERGKQVHEDVIRSGFQNNVFVGSALVDMYAKCGSIEHARHVFDKMPQRNVVSWNAMIAAYVRHGNSGEALALYYEMQRTNVRPNQFTCTSAVSACANLADLKHGRQIHGGIIRAGSQNDVVVGSALVDMYAKCGSIEDARQVFDKMPERNVVSWNTMIAAYVSHGCNKEALMQYYQMQQTRIQPNQCTFVSVLPACANLAALKHGKQIHKDIITSGLRPDFCVGSALIDMYAKCGRIEDARRVFDQIPEQNVVSWTAMIVGYGVHGHAKEALQLFEQMRHSGTKPDCVTFVGVLSACCHAGLVDDGWRYFNSISQDYHITPAVEHYCCMVDLLGRAGCLDEAYKFIIQMPIKPNAVVWGSLLSACRIHTNVELGERVAKYLFELEPKNAANYVVLSNIYAAAGRWDGTEKMRNLMKDRWVKKSPGCSWIEVNNKVHSFLVGDRSHPQSTKIHAELQRLSLQMEEAGYVPDTNLVLHDVEEEQKLHILCHHSEKMAIVFGLINTSPGTPIRVIKNLRVCGDCHSAIKFISKIVARDIVVRDTNRFHHFKDGWCSCGDYW